MLKYLDSPFLYQDTAEIIAIKDNSIILNQTIFYPKGVGQPSDKGIISLNGTQSIIKEAYVKDGEVRHNIEDISYFSIGDTVELNIDKKARLEHSAIHTLGHLIDEAMLNLDYYNSITPLKAFHYPEGPSVEYKGDLSSYNLENLRIEVENEVNKMLKAGFETQSFFISANDIDKYCHKITINSNLLNNHNDKNIRVVIVWGEKGITCMGTHVKNINQIQGISIPKISNKKGIVKFSYRLLGINE